MIAAGGHPGARFMGLSLIPGFIEHFATDCGEFETSRQTAPKSKPSKAWRTATAWLAVLAMLYAACRWYLGARDRGRPKWLVWL